MRLSKNSLHSQVHHEFLHRHRRIPWELLPLRGNTRYIYKRWKRVPLTSTKRWRWRQMNLSFFLLSTYDPTLFIGWKSSRMDSPSIVEVTSSTYTHTHRKRYRGLKWWKTFPNWSTDNDQTKLFRTVAYRVFDKNILFTSFIYSDVHWFAIMNAFLIE